MKIRYSVQNVHCQKCANVILNSLSDEFSGVEVFLDREPREVVVELSTGAEQKFKDEMEELGYPIIDELERSQ
ncbi:MAG: heavy-metal-associated domain-containing protein [Campylobacteraceae bacterium]|jgi:copper chaperone CopZ|nr:heavy-metal-associated domain-containing protein [Campylobacteraceae bacterium]